MALMDYDPISISGKYNPFQHIDGTNMIVNCDFGVANPRIPNSKYLFICGIYRDDINDDNYYDRS